MRGRRLLALLVLGALALVAAGPLLGIDACGDECPPDCGDCAGCVPPALCTAAPALADGAATSRLVAPARPALSSSAPRQLDHVPLSTIA
jgi:hypothetical protein